MLFPCLCVLAGAYSLGLCRALPADEREKTIKPLNIIGDRVETTTPWLIDQLLRGEDHRDVSWLTGGKLMGRFLLAPFKKRDLLADYPL